MNLNERLEVLLRSLPKSKILVDIGTDHAFIPILAVKRLITKRAIASDIRSGPLNVAKKNIIRNNVQDIIELRLSNGLESIREDELDTVVIAGMGGALVCEILNKDVPKTKLIKNLLIQPMNNIELVRKWLYDNGFNISHECLVREDKRIYNIIRTNFNNYFEKVSEEYYYIGKKLIENKDVLLDNYIERIININKKKILGIKKSKYANDKIYELENLVDKINKIKYEV